MKNEVVKKLVAVPKKELREISKAVALAKNEEGKALDFYRKNAEKASDIEVKKSFGFLVKEEQEHFDALSAVEKSLAEKGKFVIVSSETLKHFLDPNVYPEKPFEGTELEQKSELTALLWAMRAEKKAEAFYRQQAEKTRVKEIKKFWATLAEFEEGHFNFLDGLFEAWNDKSDLIMG